MINPVKWLKANLQNKLFNRVKWKLVLEFYLTFFIPLLYVLNIYASFKTPNTVNLPTLFVLLGIIASFFGLIVWIVSYINLGHSFGVLPQKQKRVKRGLYKYTNHPMYVGIWLTFFGLSLANSSFFGILFLILITTPMLIVRTYFEEKNLIS